MLEGKTAIVTGAGRGLGRSHALALASYGANVVVNDPGVDVHGEGTSNVAQQVVDEIIAAGGSAVANTDSCAGFAEAEAMVQQAVDTFGALDILVNNAGSIRAGSLITKTESEWQEDFALKFWGYVRLTRAVWPWLVARGGGRVLNIIGGAGRQPSAGYVAGGAANAGLMNLTKALGDEGAPHGILVNAINPGPVRTARWQSLMQRQAAERGITVAALEAEQLAHVPLRRGGEPEEIASVAVFLCSAGASYITGTTLQVDGGLARCI